MAEEPREVIVEREREPRKSPVGTIIAIIVGIVLVILVLMYALPALTGAGGTTDVDVTAPAPSATQPTN